MRIEKCRKSILYYAKDSLFFLIVVKSSTSLLFIIFMPTLPIYFCSFSMKILFSYYKSNANDSIGYIQYPRIESIYIMTIVGLPLTHYCIENLILSIHSFGL